MWMDGRKSDADVDVDVDVLVDVSVGVDVVLSHIAAPYHA